MTYKDVYIKTEDGDIIHVDEKITRFYDDYLQCRVEIYPPSDDWIRNMSKEILEHHNVNNFQFCKPNGKIIRDTIYGK